MKRITFSALNVLGLVLLMQTGAVGQLGVSVSEGSYGQPGAYLFGDAGSLPGPEEFMTQPEMRAFGPTGEGEGPSAPFYELPSYNYTGWFRPRAVNRDMGARCYMPDTFRPRGFGRLFTKVPGPRMDYRPYALNAWQSPHGPAYYNTAEDERCPHCDKQGCTLGSCLQALHDKKCALLGHCPLVGCGTCGGDQCDGGCEDVGCDTCDACDDSGCGVGGRLRGRFSHWITRPRRNRFRDAFVGPGSCDCDACQSASFGQDGGCASCQAASSGGVGCTSCGNAASGATGCASCQLQSQSQQLLQPPTFQSPISGSANFKAPTQTADRSYENDSPVKRGARIFDNGAGVLN